MNIKQAHKEAVRRWGKNGYVRQNKQEGPTRCAVGEIVMGLMFVVKGQGPNFAAAFRNHDTSDERSKIFDEAKGQPCPRCSRTMTSEKRANDLTPGEKRRIAAIVKELAAINKMPPDKSKPGGWKLELRRPLAREQWEIEHVHYPVMLVDGDSWTVVCRACVTEKDERS